MARWSRRCSSLKHLPLSYLAYARVLYLPVLVLCALIVFGNQWVLKPEKALDTSAEFVRNKLRELGAFKRDEMITALIVLCSIVFWSTDRWHHLPSFFIGMVGLAVFALAGIVGNADIAGGISWTLLLFMGGIFSLQNVLTEYKLTDWLAGYFVPIMQHLTFNAVIALVAVGIATLALRFLDPSGFIAIVVTFVPLVDTTSAAGIPPLVLTAALLIPSVPFWATYQNIWVAMGEGITEGLAFSGAERVRLATMYAVFRPAHRGCLGWILEINRSAVMQKGLRIGFVGFGEAAYHIAKGLRQPGLTSITAFDINTHTLGLCQKIRQRAKETWDASGGFEPRNWRNRATS